MNRVRNITRYEASMGNSYAFMGWRLCITRRGARFVRYFSDREYGDSERAFAAALQMRNDILFRLEEGENPTAVFREFRKRYL